MVIVALGWFVVWSKWNKIVSQKFRIHPEIRVRMMLPGLNRMSKNGVYPLSVPSSLSEGIEFEAALSRSNFGSQVVIVALGWFVVWSKWNKIVLQKFRIHPEVRVRMMLPGLNRMSEDGVYPLSVSSSLFEGIEFEATLSRSNFGSRGVHCSIGMVRCVVQVE